MATDARTQLALLRSAVLAATAASQTLEVWLGAEILTRFNAGIRTGKFVAGTSAGGTSTSYQIASAYGLNPADVFKCWDEFLELYSAVSTALTAVNGSAPNQASVVTEMRFRLQPVESGIASFDDEFCGRTVEAATT